MKKRILITGGAGYIGSHVTQAFINNNFNVIIFDSFVGSDETNVLKFKKNKNVKIITGDLRNKKSIDDAIKNNRIDFVIHLAALTSVPESLANPGLYFENNLVGGLNLLESMVNNKVKKIIYSSTCAVYGEPQYLPVDEQHPISPNNPYGESKYMFEKMLNWYSKAYGVRYGTFRFFNVVGVDPKGIIGDSRINPDSLLCNLIDSNKKGKFFYKTFPKLNTNDGSPIRDFIDISDLVDAHLATYDYLNQNGENIILNLGTGKGISVKKAIETVKKFLNKKIKIKEGKIRKEDTRSIYADSSLAKKILKWETKVNLDESIKNMVKWYNSRKDE
jgi:UDP-glucose 4-epimerase